MKDAHNPNEDSTQVRVSGSANSKRRREDSLERDLRVLKNHRSRNNLSNRILTKKLNELYADLNHVVFNDTNGRSRRQILEGAVDYIKWLKEQIQR